MRLNKTQQNIIVDTAFDALKYGLKFNTILPVSAKAHDSELQQQHATFVTLNIHGNLRGCIGSLIASQSLIEDVAANAFRAGFQDPRFSPISEQELTVIELSISILSQPQVLSVKDEADLLSKLRVGIDGLILQDQNYRSTFLPSVWGSLTTPQQFVNHLKQKAGLAENHWSATIKFFTYQTEVIQS